jgi:hypothetical protein
LTLGGVNRLMMFEGKPPKPDAGASLQAVSWADLSARLSAARDLRKALAEDDNGEGSFDAASARWIADHAAQDFDEQPDVNPVGLGNGKAVNGMAGVEGTLSTPGDRGNE